MPEGGPSHPRRLEIKKYPNRRYYDATHSRHLTLDEIRNLIRQGYDIHVVDAKSSADITAQVLAQIILELETPKLDSFPVPLLIRLIRVNDTLVKDFIEKYFNQAFQSFQDYQHQFEEHLRKAHGLPGTLPAMTAWTQSVINPFTAAFSGASPAPGPGPNPPPPAAEDNSSNQDLRAMLRDLQEQVAALKRRPPAARPQARTKPARRGKKR